MPEGQTTHKARGLDADDIEQVEQGLLVTVHRSKTDQESKRHQTAIGYGARPETCPVCALEAWMQRAEIESGLLFRNVTRASRVGDSLTGQTVARIVQSCARRSAFDPKEFGGIPCGPGSSPARQSGERRRSGA